MPKITLLSTLTLPEMTDLVKREFYTYNRMLKSNAMSLFMKDTVGKGQGGSKLYHEVDTLTFGRRKREGEHAKKAQVALGFPKLILKKRFGIELDITQEMRDETKEREILGVITSVKHYIPNRRELDLTHRFTFCNATSYVDMDGDVVDTTVGDGLALVNASHLLKNSSLTFSNVITGNPAFSETALEIAETVGVNGMLSSFGESRTMDFDTIVTGNDPAIANAIRRLFGSKAQVGQANSGVMNVYQDKYRHVQLPYLATTATGAPDATKSKWWFLVATGQRSEDRWQAYYVEWESPFLKTPLEDGHRDVWTYGARGSWGIGVLSARGFLASLATS